MKLKPFDLEGAIAGKQVVTREGYDFLFGGYNPISVDVFKLIGWVNGRFNIFREDGTSGASEYELFMAPEKIVRWVNIYPTNMISHETQVGALNSRMPDCIACIRIEFEDGEGL